MSASPSRPTTSYAIALFAVDSKFVRGEELLNILEKRLFAVLFHVRAAQINELMAVLEIFLDAVAFRGERLA